LWIFFTQQVEKLLIVSLIVRDQELRVVLWVISWIFLYNYSLDNSDLFDILIIIFIRIVELVLNDHQELIHVHFESFCNLQS
jgi:hypothetical protein